MKNRQIVETEFDPAALHHKETLFTIGNGYLGTRGSFEEGYPGEQAAVLVNGIFDDVPVYCTELVNCPNWLDLRISLGGEPFRMDRGQVLEYRRELDLATGALSRELRWKSPAGKTVELRFERFASLADEHVLGLRCRVRSIDFRGQLEIRAGIEGRVDNLGWRHWKRLEQGHVGEDGAYLLVETRATQLRLCEACRLSLAGSPAGAPQAIGYRDGRWKPTLVARARLEPGNQVLAEKLVTIYTSREAAEAKAAALAKLEQAAALGYEALRAASDEAWRREWERGDVLIEGDDEADLALRYNLFQLLIAAPRRDERVSIPARTLSGFGYRGHAFWDTEIFMLPFFTFTRPEIARNLLLYRYHTLPAARQKARQAGFEGALYAWESAATGEETTPRWLPQPDGGEPVGILYGELEHHISADIAYGVQQYWAASGDDDFMRDFGAEIVLETARFWSARLAWNQARRGYSIPGVVGPDEYHERVDDNAYTNNLARWNLAAALQALEWLREAYPSRAAELEERLDLNPERLAGWRERIERLYLGYVAESRLYEQFEGFFRRKELDLQAYEPRSQSIQRLLGYQAVQEYQVLKQPDVLMLLFLLRESVPAEVLEANWAYYTPRTDLTCGSSLGPAIQAALAARLGRTAEALHWFSQAAGMDLRDAHGNAAEGIHAAAAGGLWQAAVFGFGGLEFGSGGPTARPRLPAGWKRLAFRITYRGRLYDFDLRSANPADAPGLTPRPGAGGVGLGEPGFPILGAIFDLDGVLTDTAEFHYQAWKRLAEEEGLPFDRQSNEALRGLSRRDSLLRLLRGRLLPEAQIQEWLERKNRYYGEFVARLKPENLLPGARGLLEQMRKAGLRIAIGSASRNARRVVEKLGIAGLVDAISDGFSVARLKPAPDLFLHAAGQLGIPARHCVVFEDAAAGIQAARASGMWVVGIGPRWRVGAAHLVCDGLEGLTWEGVQAGLAGSGSSRPPNPGDRLPAEGRGGVS